MCSFDSNLLTGIATLLLAVITGVYVWLIHEQNQDNVRPFVYANLDEVGHNVFFVIRNTGKTAARNVIIETSPSLSGLNLQYADRFPIEPFLRQPLVPPDTELRTYICNSMYAHLYHTREGHDGEFTITLRYNDTRRSYAESYKISVSSIVYNHLYPNDKIEESLSKISESIKKIEEHCTRESGRDEELS